VKRAGDLDVWTYVVENLSLIIDWRMTFLMWRWLLRSLCCLRLL
jgi:hypothetical protein